MQAAISFETFANSLDPSNLVNKTREFVETVSDPDKLRDPEDGTAQHDVSESTSENAVDRLISSPFFSKFAGNRLEALTKATSEFDLSNSVSNLVETARTNFSDISDLDSLQVRQEIQELKNNSNTRTSVPLKESSKLNTLDSNGNDSAGTQTEPLVANNRSESNSDQLGPSAAQLVKPTISHQNLDIEDDYYDYDPARAAINTSSFFGRYANTRRENDEAAKGSSGGDDQKSRARNEDNPMEALQEAISLGIDSCRNLNEIVPFVLKRHPRLAVLLCIFLCVVFSIVIFFVGLEIMAEDHHKAELQRVMP